jgi:RNA 3'-phosphate cyclase
VDTAGSVGLILQIIQLACVQSSGNIVLNVEGGATFGLWAPTLPYIENVTIPQLAKMGYNITVKISRHGFYPKGGAKVMFEIKPPKQLKPLILSNFGEKIIEFKGISIASSHLKNQNVAMRQANAATQVIKKTLGITPVFNTEYVDALSPGSGICIWLKTDSGVILGYDIIGEKGKPSEKIGTECARYLCEIVQRKATIDRFFSDQIIPFLALAKGISIIRPSELTNHAKTNIWIVERFLGKKYLIKKVDSLHEITIENP